MTADRLREDNILHLQDVVKKYGEKIVLGDIDLSIGKGEVISLVGPSGCGKSTLFRLINGREPATSGILELNDKPIYGPGSDRGIVYQKYGLFPNLTALDNVLMYRKLSMPFWMWPFKKKDHIEEAMQFLEKGKMGKHADKYPHELSGGQQQRVAIAQALVAKPAIMMMDEPFSALDPGTREDMQMFILELWEELGMTILFVTHDLEEALFVGTRVAVLSQYYTDEETGKTGLELGSRIVKDIKLPNCARAWSTRAKYTEEFGSLIKDIRDQGFNPDYLQRMQEFDLSHPNSFITIPDEEVKVAPV